MYPIHPIHPLLMSPYDMQMELAKKARKARLRKRLTQAELSLRSGVSLASLRRFERTGAISLSSLLALANALGELQGFAELFPEPPVTSLFETPARQPLRGRSTRKTRSPQKDSPHDQAGVAAHARIS